MHRALPWCIKKILGKVMQLVLALAPTLKNFSCLHLATLTPLFSAYYCEYFTCVN